MKEKQKLQVLESIRKRIEQLPGYVDFYYKNLVSGFEYGVGAEESYLAASVIKLPLYLHILVRSASETLDMNEKLLVT